MLLFSSSSSHSSHGDISNVEFSEPSYMTSLGKLIDQHIAALQTTADAIHAADEGRTTATALLSVARKEEADRLAIINYSPQGDGEAKQKLIYLAAYLIATQNTLTAHEMTSVLEAPRQRASALVA